MLLEFKYHLRQFKFPQGTLFAFGPRGNCLLVSLLGEPGWVALEAAVPAIIGITTCEVLSNGQASKAWFLETKFLRLDRH